MRLRFSTFMFIVAAVFLVLALVSAISALQWTQPLRMHQQLVVMATTNERRMLAEQGVTNVLLSMLNTQLAQVVYLLAAFLFAALGYASLRDHD